MKANEINRNRVTETIIPLFLFVRLFHRRLVFLFVQSSSQSRQAKQSTQLCSMFMMQDAMPQS